MEGKTLLVEEKIRTSPTLSLPNSEDATDTKGFIEILNRDCLLKIFSYLTLKERIQCENVCRCWRVASLESWRSVREIKMTRLFLDVWLRWPQLEDIIGILKKSTRALTSLDLSDCSFPENTNTDLSKVLSMVTDNLTCLHMNNLQISVPIPQVVQTLTERVPHLKELSIHDTLLQKKTLKSLLDGLPEIEILDVAGNELSLELLSVCSKLKSLRISDCFMDSCKVPLARFVEGLENLPLESLTISFYETQYQLKIPCKNLKQLTLGLWYSHDDHVENYLDFSCLPKLEELKVIQAANLLMNDANIKSLVKHCPLLKKLSVECLLDHECINLPIFGIELFVIEDFFKAIKKLEHLEHLDISYFHMAFKDHLESLTKFKKLQSLIMHKITDKMEVSFEDLIYLIDSLPSLTLLDISGSVNLSEENLNLPEFYNKFSSEPSEGKPNTEIVLGGCDLDLSEVTKCGRFIINGADNSIPFGGEFHSDSYNFGLEDRFSDLDFTSDDDEDVDEFLYGCIEDLGDFHGVF